MVELFEEIKFQILNGIAFVTLFRPNRRNAFTLKMGRELEQVFKFISKEDQIRVVILTGEGTSFCSGLDLKNVESFNDSLKLKNDSTNSDLVGSLGLCMYNCTKPIIAAINGDAIGIGATMILPASLRVVSENARIGFVFTRRGLAMEACSSFFLTRIVGMSKASEWILSGRIFKAKEVLKYHLSFNFGRKKKVIYSIMLFQKMKSWKKQYHLRERL